MDYSKIEGLRIVLGYGCNYSCSFCYQDSYEPGWMSERELIEKVTNLPIPFDQIRYITVMGGEATCDPEFMAKMRFLRSFFPDKTISLTTNGSGGCSNQWGHALDIYQKLLYHVKIDHISFSLPAALPEDYRRLVKTRNDGPIDVRGMIGMMFDLARDFDPRSFRINTYLSPYWVPCYHLAKLLEWEFTLCAELRAKANQEKYILEEAIHRMPSGTVAIGTKGCNSIFRDKDGFEFWLYQYNGDEGNDNLILVPDAVKHNTNGLRRGLIR